MTRITISGLPGTGTTTLATRLSKRFRLPVVSTGSVFRQMAADRGITVEELGAVADTDPSFDRALDGAAVDAVRSIGGGWIVESRLAGMLFRDADLHVWLYALDDVRSARVLKRSGETKDEMHTREAREVRRFRDIYGWTPDMLSLYDICINTARFDESDVEDLVVWGLVAGRKAGRMVRA